MEMQPPNRRTLVESVTEQIMSLIAEGQLKPGDKLPSQSELVERLQVGRSTVREALKSLVAIKLLDMKAGRGTFVRQPDSSSILRPDLLALRIKGRLTEELLEAREIIEPHIAALAAQRATQEDFAQICSILEKCRDALQAGEPVYELSSTFHSATTQAAHNQVLMMFIGSIHGLLAERGVLMDTDRDYLRWELESHQTIYECIRNRDVMRASALMEDHIKQSNGALADMIARFA
jgi:GntR family transcriptional repressor for pyruvate dehydrogenase complex